MTLSHFVTLPTDILLLVIHFLPPSSLASLGQTCLALRDFIDENGWKLYLTVHPRYSASSVSTGPAWSAKKQVRLNHLSDQAWLSRNFITRPLSVPWKWKFRPVLQNSNTRLVVAAGQQLHVYDYAPGLRVLPHRTASLSDYFDARQDITGLAFLPDGGMDRTLCVSHADGRVARVVLTEVETSHGPRHKRQQKQRLGLTTTALYPHPRCAVKSLTSSGNYILSLGASGLASLFCAATPWVLPSTIQTSWQLWGGHLSLKSSQPFLALGKNGPRPLSIHSITESRIEPMASVELAGERAKSASYAIAESCSGSPWGGSPEVLLSGWYDGNAYIHDLRSRSRRSMSDTAQTVHSSSPLAPVMKFGERLGDSSPIYCIAMGGGHSSHVVAGRSEHGVVSIWDVRQPKQGWSLYTPGMDWSSVYSLALEGSRMFTATQYGPFVTDFGRDVDAQTYPWLPSNSIADYSEGDIGYSTTTYSHSVHSVQVHR